VRDIAEVDMPHHSNVLICDIPTSKSDIRCGAPELLPADCKTAGYRAQEQYELELAFPNDAGVWQAHLACR
jgi:hypothetical protein